MKIETKFDIGEEVWDSVNEKYLVITAVFYKDGKIRYSLRSKSGDELHGWEDENYLTKKRPREIGKEYTAKELKIGDVIVLPNSKDSPFMHMRVTGINESIGEVICVRPHVTREVVVCAETFIAYFVSETKYVLLDQQ